MKQVLLLAAAATLSVSASAAAPAPAPKAPAGGTFQICLWPNPCSGEPHAPRQETPNDARPNAEAIPGDPLTRAVIQGNISQGDDGIVSSIRLTKEHTGVSHDQIITRGAGLRDALAPVGTAALPASRVPPSKKGAKKPASDEWVRVDVPSETAGQLNEMRTERRALDTGSEGSHGALGRMWKDKKK